MTHFRSRIGLLGLALVARIVVAAWTAIPGRDAAHYLWMAERTAEGHAGALFQTVFHPGFPLAVAGPIALGQALGLEIEPFRWAQIVALTCGALAILPLHAITCRLYDARAAFWTALLYAIGAWFCRHPADALSEGVFYLCVCVWAERLIGAPGGATGSATGGARAVQAGIAAACAYACRPEGAALGVVAALWLWRSDRRADCGRSLLAAAICAAPLPIGWMLAGNGFTVSPKASFTYGVGVGHAVSEGWGEVVAYYLRELGKLPGAALDDLGFLVLPLAVMGAIMAMRKRARFTADPRILLLVPFAIQCTVIPLLFAHYRFVSGFGVLLLPFAGAATLVCARVLGRHRRLLVVGAALLVASEVVRLPHPRRSDRIIVRDLGRWLGGRLRPGQGIATDMPRLAYYAGLRPPPPRPTAPREILAAARLPETRFIAIVRERTPLAEGALAALGFRTVTLPASLAKLVVTRDAVVLERGR